MSASGGPLTTREIAAFAFRIAAPTTSRIVLCSGWCQKSDPMQMVRAQRSPADLASAFL